MRCSPSVSGRASGVNRSAVRVYVGSRAVWRDLVSWDLGWTTDHFFAATQQAYQGGNHVGNQRKGWLVPTNVVTNVVGNHFSAR